MKIIGETKEGYILEANKDEVAIIQAFSWYGEDKVSKIGHIIDITPVYKRYKAFERIIKSADFKNALDRLKDTIEVLTPVEELFNQTKEIIKE